MDVSLDKLIIHDIETLEEVFVVVCLIPGEPIYKWEVSKWKNELDSFMKFVDSHQGYYWVGYNNLRFDAQVLEWIIRNYNNWFDYNALELTSMISQKAQDIIDDINYEVFPEFREERLSLRQLDPFKINHYDNKNRMVGLKRLEFEMDMVDLEVMPVHHTKTNLTREEVVKTIKYCIKDVKATYRFFLITIGETEHPLYKGNNQVQLRFDIEKEFGLKCLNFSDSKIGDEIIKKYYCEETNKEYSELPKKGTFRKDIRLYQCIAKYIKFETPQLKKFLKDTSNKVLGIKDEFKETIDFYGVKYSFMKGGLHSENKPQIFEEDNDHLIIDWDVSSYYPAIIINNGKYPSHLGKAFLRGYIKLYEKRLKLKPLAKDDKKIKGIVGALKLAVNAVYGKSSDMTSWLYDRLLTMFTTITGEFSLMMLIEKYELSGIKVISANTDGVTIRIHKSLIDKMHEINQWWMDITKYNLERTDYRKIVFSSVNDYIAIKTDGKLKKKGDFLTDFELHKNKSARVVNIALEKYFVNGIPVEETIKNHKNIYDFALRQKSSKNFHYEGIKMNGKSNEKTVYDKLIRYYVAKKGEKILKIKNPECTTNAAPVSQVHAGGWLCHVCNHLPKSHPLDNINYSFYINKANKIVDNIRYEGRKHVSTDVNQLKMF